MTYRDEGWHDNNELARADAMAEYEMRQRTCPRCWVRRLPDVDADTLRAVHDLRRASAVG